MRVAEIVKAGKHPSVQKLKVCTVSDGTDIHQVRRLPGRWLRRLRALLPPDRG